MDHDHQPPSSSLVEAALCRMADGLAAMAEATAANANSLALLVDRVDSLERQVRVGGEAVRRGIERQRQQATHAAALAVELRRGTPGRD